MKIHLLMLFFSFATAQKVILYNQDNNQLVEMDKDWQDFLQFGQNIIKSTELNHENIQCMLREDGNCIQVKFKVTKRNHDEIEVLVDKTEALDCLRLSSSATFLPTTDYLVTIFEQMSLGDEKINRIFETLITRRKLHVDSQTKLVFFQEDGMFVYKKTQDRNECLWFLKWPTVLSNDPTLERNNLDLFFESACRYVRRLYDTKGMREVYDFCQNYIDNYLYSSKDHLRPMNNFLKWVENKNFKATLKEICNLSRSSHKEKLSKFVDRINILKDKLSKISKTSLVPCNDLETASKMDVSYADLYWEALLRKQQDIFYKRFPAAKRLDKKSNLEDFNEKKEISKIQEEKMSILKKGLDNLFAQCKMEGALEYHWFIRDAKYSDIENMIKEYEEKYLPQ